MNRPENTKNRASREDRCSVPSDKNRAGRGIAPSRRSGTRNKILTASALALLIVGCSFCFGMIAGPDIDGGTYDFQEGDYLYRIYDTNKAAIASYVSDGAEVQVPSKVVHGGITYSVESIDASAFEKRTSIKSVTIPDGITSIDAYAFDGCTNLTSIEIPDSVTYIGKQAFAYCTSLKSVTIPNGVTSIEYNTFRGCTSLVSVTVPDSVTSIGFQAFYKCISLTSVTIPDGVTSIGNNAFNECTSLKSVMIPSGVTSIEYRTFNGCTSLESVTITDNVASIGEEAFCGCTSLRSVEISKNVTSDGEEASSERTGLESATATNGNSSIQSSAFSGCRSLESVEIPDKITAIGTNAFYYCTSLKTVTIPDGVTYFGESAFIGCKSLNSITIPNGVTYIGKYAFFQCESLTSVTIPNGVTTIDRCTFYECTRLTSIEIPDSVTSIGLKAFYYCTSLTSIEIPDSVTSIGVEAFNTCGLQSISFGTGITTIGQLAFSYYKPGASYWLPTIFYDENGKNITFAGMDQFRGKEFKGSMKAMNRISQYTLTFMDGEDTLKTVKHYNGDNIADAPIPTKEGYTFKSWKTEKDEIFDLKTRVMPASNLTLYAVWEVTEKFTVTYIVTPGNSQGIVVESGTQITLPQNEEWVTNPGHSLSKWKIDENNEYNPGVSYTVTSDVTFTAKWDANR